MRVRVKAKRYGGGAFTMYYGEVYATWSIPFTCIRKTGWMKVTRLCFTEEGAKAELQKYKNENFPDEFTL